MRRPCSFMPIPLFDRKPINPAVPIKAPPADERSGGPGRPAGPARHRALYPGRRRARWHRDRDRDGRFLVEGVSPDGSHNACHRVLTRS